MATTTAGPAMAKGRGRPKKPGGEGTPVRIDSELVAKAKYLAALCGVALSDLLSEFLRPVVEREFRKAGRELLGDQDR
jgi:hypothetical protein